MDGPIRNDGGVTTVIKLPSIHVFLAIGFLVMLLYARSAARLQPLFVVPATIVGLYALCYLWKTVLETSRLSYVSHASALTIVWALYWLNREKLIQRLTPSSAEWVSIGVYFCLALFTLLLLQRLCRPSVGAARRWAAVLLALYPVSFIVVSPAVKHTADRHVPVLHFGSVVEQIKFDGIALPHEDQEIYRYHTTRRAVPIPEGIAIGDTLYAPRDLKIHSIYLRVDKSRGFPNTAFLEVIGKDGQARYALPRTVEFDGAMLESEGSSEWRTKKQLTDREGGRDPMEDSDKDFIDGQLVIISNGRQPYDWDVFYLLESLKER